MLRRLFLVALCILVLGSQESNGQNSPFEFVQRNDVQEELQIQPEQVQILQNLQPICDAQCQARITEMLTSASTDLQTQFLALGAEGQQVAVQDLDQGVRDGIETEMLDEVVLSSPQFERFQQLRTQFDGLGSLLNDRVSGLMGLSQEQTAQLRELQNFGAELEGMCGQDSSLSPTQKQNGIQNIQNVIIDQSINVLNGAQIEIFAGLCGRPCEFCDDDSPADDIDPGDENTPNDGNATDDNLVETELIPTQPQPVGPQDTEASTPTSGIPQPQNVGSSGSAQPSAVRSGTGAASQIPSSSSTEEGSQSR